MVAGGSYPIRTGHATARATPASSAGRTNPGLRRGRQDQVARVLPVVLGRQRTDSPDHRSHVAYGLDEDDFASTAPTPTVPRIAPGQDPAARLPRPVRRLGRHGYRLSTAASCTPTSGTRGINRDSRNWSPTVSVASACPAGKPRTDTGRRPRHTAEGNRPRETNFPWATLPLIGSIPCADTPANARVAV